MNRLMLYGIQADPKPPFLGGNQLILGYCLTEGLNFEQPLKIFHNPLFGIVEARARHHLSCIGIFLFGFQNLNESIFDELLQGIFDNLPTDM